MNATATLPNGQKVKNKVYKNGLTTVRTDVGWNYNPGKAAYQPMDDGKDPVLARSFENVLQKKEKEKEKELLREISKAVQEKGLIAVKDFAIETKKINRLTKDQTKDSIIYTNICGLDRIHGSCSSLAFAYIGNRHGLKVLDFRGGISRTFFSSATVMEKICELAKGIRIEHHNDYAAAKRMLKTIKEGKRYLLAVGKHVAIIKKQNGKNFFLELQDSVGYFSVLDQEELKYRFRCQYSHTLKKQRYKARNYIFDVDNLKGNKEFENLLEYINTAEDEKLKN